MSELVAMASVMCCHEKEQKNLDYLKVTLLVSKHGEQFILVMR